MFTSSTFSFCEFYHKITQNVCSQFIAVFTKIMNQKRIILIIQFLFFSYSNNFLIQTFICHKFNYAIKGIEKKYKNLSISLLKRLIYPKFHQNITMWYLVYLMVMILHWLNFDCRVYFMYYSSILQMLKHQIFQIYFSQPLWFS